MYKTIVILSCLIVNNKGAQNAPTKVCYVHLGCLETNNSWYSPNRPYNPQTSSRESINTTFQLYTIATRKEGEAIFTDYETFNSRVFNKNAEKNFFLIHGFLSWGKVDWIMDIKDELLNIYNKRANVFSVDWSSRGVDYAQTASNARVVGLEIAKFINSILIKNENVSANTIHLIGHSLGAHVSGYVGERVSKLYRITGLDPAGQHFAGMPSYVRLDPSDAQFVDIIHSDTQGYGTNRPMGDIDFYANGEGEQPGCGALNMFPQFLNQGMNTTLQETGTCSHSRAHQYFIESLQNYKSPLNTACKFIAYRCNSYQDLAEGKCANNCMPDNNEKCMYIGLEAKQIINKKNVIMYFKTAAFKPYCLVLYYIDIGIAETSLPTLYSVVHLTVYDAKGTATTWTFNDGHPMLMQSKTVLSTFFFSTTILSYKEVHMVNLRWNSRFYPFGLLRKALLNGYIKIKYIKISTIEGKRIKLCPRGVEKTIEVYENKEIMFYVDTCIKSVNNKTAQISQ